MESILGSEILASVPDQGHLNNTPRVRGVGSMLQVAPPSRLQEELVLASCFREVIFPWLSKPVLGCKCLGSDPKQGVDLAFHSGLWNHGCTVCMF